MLNSLDLSWGFIIATVFISGHLTVACVSIYLHRCQTHQSLALSRWLSFPMRVWLWLSSGMVTREWVACHRKHHAYVDREGDPHSPVLYGWLNVLFFGVFYYTRAFKDKTVVLEFGKGTLSDWFERHLFTPYNAAGIVTLLVIDFLVFGGLHGAIIWGLQMTWVPFWAAGVVNGVGHKFGYRNFNTADHSRNIVPIGVWLLGEELHNNHHNDPSSPKFSVKWFEFDISWLYVKIFERLGLAKVLNEKKEVLSKAA